MAASISRRRPVHSGYVSPGHKPHQSQISPTSAAGVPTRGCDTMKAPASLLARTAILPLLLAPLRAIAADPWVTQVNETISEHIRIMDYAQGESQIILGLAVAVGVIGVILA